MQASAAIMTIRLSFFLDVTAIFSEALLYWFAGVIQILSIVLDFLQMVANSLV